ncbi:MAG: hypothetical protein SPE04_10775 [Prevotella sp.]|nr:hypothetical protein [Prevotella sp.]
MKKGVCIALISCCMLGGMCFDANAQTLKNYAKQRNQELAERQRMEKTNYEKACQKNTLAAYNEYLSMYPKGKYVQDVRKRVAEIERKNEQDLYDYAAKVETAQAYEAYLKKYPNGRFAQEARGRLEDMELWKKAKSANTIAAYRNYLSTSKNKSFAQLANDAITDLESKDAWNAIKQSSSKSVIENFIQKYPKSSCLPEANKRLNELTAVELYGQGDLQHAYDKFEAAGGRYSVEYSNRSKYDECLEYVEFKKLNSYTKESDLLAFLKKYPSSRYYDQVSNMVAIAKAKNFSMYASSYTFNEAMSYAKDKTTKNTVQSYIDNTKKSYSQYKRQQRHKRVMANGGYVKFGLEIMDLAFAGTTSGEGQSTMYYNMGLSVKFGNYKAPVQFEVGIKPGVVHTEFESWYHGSYYDYDYGYETSETKTFFHMPVYAKLKLNICDAGRSKFYIAGLGTYNAVRDKQLENEYSLGGGAGFAWKKWDWFALYYKQDLENDYHLEDKFIGTSFVYYF